MAKRLESEQLTNSSVSVDLARFTQPIRGFSESVSLNSYLRHRRLVRNGRYYQQPPDIEREGKERNVAGCGRECWHVNGDALQQHRGEFSQPATFGRVQSGNNQVLKNEGGAKKDYETSQQPTRVEDRKLIGPERPKKKEREHPMQQTVLRQHRIKCLGRSEEKCNQRQQMRDVCQHRLF